MELLASHTEEGSGHNILACLSQIILLTGIQNAGKKINHSEPKSIAVRRWDTEVKTQPLGRGGGWLGNLSADDVT